MVVGWSSYRTPSGHSRPCARQNDGPEQLVPREHVAEDLGVLAGGDARSCARGAAARIQGGSCKAVALPAHDRARHEVGARLRRACRPAWRSAPGGTTSSESSEAEQVAGHVPEPLVAGRAQAAGSAMCTTRTRGSRAAYALRDLARPVGRAVVDDHHLEVDAGSGRAGCRGDSGQPAPPRRTTGTTTLTPQRGWVVSPNLTKRTYRSATG